MQGISQATLEKKNNWKFDLRDPEIFYLITLRLKIKNHWSDLMFSPKFIFHQFLISHTPKVSQVNQ